VGLLVELGSANVARVGGNLQEGLDIRGPDDHAFQRDELAQALGANVAERDAVCFRGLLRIRIVCLMTARLWVPKGKEGAPPPDGKDPEFVPAHEHGRKGIEVVVSVSIIVVIVGIRIRIRGISLDSSRIDILLL